MNPFSGVRMRLVADGFRRDHARLCGYLFLRPAVDGFRGGLAGVGRGVVWREHFILRQVRSLLVNDAAAGERGIDSRTQVNIRRESWASSRETLTKWPNRSRRG